MRQVGYDLGPIEALLRPLRDTIAIDQALTECGASKGAIAFTSHTLKSSITWITFKLSCLPSDANT
jgi:hypothetical protein